MVRFLLRSDKTQVMFQFFLALINNKTERNCFLEKYLMQLLKKRE